MKKIFFILFLIFNFFNLKAEKITKNNVKHILLEEMYKDEFDEFNFEVLENETNNIIKKEDLKELTTNILFHVDKSPVKALFIASKDGVLSWSRGDKTIYCLGMTLLEYKEMNIDKELNKLYISVNEKIENLLLKKTEYNLEKYYLGKNIVIYRVENINFSIRKYPEEKSVEIEIEKFY